MKSSYHYVLQERPAYALAGKGNLFYISITPSKERYLRRFEFATSRDTSLLNIRRMRCLNSSHMTSRMASHITMLSRRTSGANNSSSIQYNPDQQYLLVVSTDGDQSQ